MVDPNFKFLKFDTLYGPIIKIKKNYLTGYEKKEEAII
jgi:hypothetical protein